MSLNWNLEPPIHSELKDRQIPLTGSHLSGKRVALLVTGSIAAYRIPDLIRDFRREGANVEVYITKSGLQYVAKDALEWCSQNRVIDSFSSTAEHLSDSTPFDVFVIAPASYNSINKAALGIADSIVSATIAAAIGRMERNGIPVLFAPAMHGTMHNSILSQSMKKLIEMGATLIQPIQRHGKNNLCSSDLIVATTIRLLNKSLMSNSSLLITGGPTPVPVDSIRCLTTSFTGSLSIQIAKEAWLRGAKVKLILGKGSYSAPEYLNTLIADSYEEYKKYVSDYLLKKDVDWGIFSAAVADFAPETVFQGKISSKLKCLNLKLLPTSKLIDEVRKNFPKLKMITFKYEENISHEKLIEIVKKRFSKKSSPQLIVANRREEFKKDGTQVAWLMEPKKKPQKFVGKEAIANAILDRIEILTKTYEKV